MLLSLDAWRVIIGYSPWIFNGFSTGSNSGVAPTPSGCNQPMQAHSWQDSDNGSRDDVAFAIQNAENTLRSYLGYSVAPHYAEEMVSYPPPQYWNYSDAWPSVQLNEGYVIALGPQLLTGIVNAGALNYSDLDGDTIKETFTLTFATTLTDPTTIRAYFAAADRWDGSGVSDRWEVRPIRVSILNGVCTIRGNSWLLAKPVLYEGVGKKALNPTDANNFVTSLDIYTSTTNQTGIAQTDAQGLLIYDSQPYPSWGFCCGVQGVSGSDPATQGYVLARGNIIGNDSGRQGWVYLGASVYNAGVWSATYSWAGCNYPERALIRYKAGYPLDSNVYSPYYGQMNRQYQEIVARLAAAQLVRPPIPCESAANRELARWQLDRAQVRGRNDEIYSTTRRTIECPFGTKAGELWAFDQVMNLQVAQGITI